MAPTFAALVSAISVVPAEYNRVAQSDSGLRFETGAPTANAGVVNAVDIRRVVVPVVNGASRHWFFASVEGLLRNGTVPGDYIVSFEGNAIVLTHPDDSEYANIGTLSQAPGVSGGYEHSVADNSKQIDGITDSDSQ
jgi:hypothetical protein